MGRKDRPVALAISSWSLGPSVTFDLGFKGS